MAVFPGEHPSSSGDRGRRLALGPDTNGLSSAALAAALRERSISMRFEATLRLTGAPGFDLTEFHRARTRQYLARAILQLAPRSDTALEAHAERLRSPEVHVRLDAALQLGTFGEQAKDHVQNLIEALGDSHDRVRQEVITALGMLGETAAAARPRLEAMAERSDSPLAPAARAALLAIQAH